MAPSIVTKAIALYDAYNETVVEVLRTGFQYGFIPLIIVFGMRTEPRPTLLQLIQPM